MADIFTYVPSRGFSRTSKPTVNTVKFGSGYSQRVAYGINNLDDSWDLQFTNQPLSTANNILDFLLNTFYLSHQVKLNFSKLFVKTGLQSTLLI
jgi:phage-related protein